MAGVAERLHAYLCERRVDFMLLFYLRHPNLLNDNILCQKLACCLQAYCIRQPQMNNVEFRKAFFNYLRSKLVLGELRAFCV